MDGVSRIELDLAQAKWKLGSKELPLVGFGTYPLKGDVCTEAVREAIGEGYRLIDTAAHCQNFSSIADALLYEDRDDFYIVSKVWPDMQSAQAVILDLERTLEQLRTDYLDAYLVHWPNSKIPIEDTLRAMQALQEKKKIRQIGLSNISLNHLKRALQVGVPIHWVQVEMHPFFCDKALVDFCRINAIAIQAWRPLGLGRTAADSVLQEIGSKYQKTACQVALRWAVQKGCLPIARSKNAAHMKENFAIGGFALSQEEMEKIDSRATKGKRFRLKIEHGLGFADEFDYPYEECWPSVK